MNEVERIRAAGKFDSIFMDDESFFEFYCLFERYGKDCPAIFEHIRFIDKMLSPDFICQCDDCQLFAIQHGIMSDKDNGIYMLAKAILDRRIPDRIRAVFYNTLREMWFYNDYEFQRLNKGLHGDTRTLFDIIIRHKVGTDEQILFARQILSMNIKRSSNFALKPCNEQLIKAICMDSISLFEINRQLLGIDIGASLLDSLIIKGAENIFLHLLKNTPEKVFKTRSKENWLFAIVNSRLHEKIVVKFINLFETIDPGIVARVRDPWGNSLLLYAPIVDGDFSNKPLHRRLIELGCEQPCWNISGLSGYAIQKFGIETFAIPFRRKYCLPS